MLFAMKFPFDSSQMPGKLGRSSKFMIYNIVSSPLAPPQSFFLFYQFRIVNELSYHDTSAFKKGHFLIPTQDKAPHAMVHIDLCDSH